MKFDTATAVKVELQPRKNRAPRKTYIFKCAYEGCGKTIKIRQAELEGGRSPFCTQHSHVKRPFESIYLGLKRDHRKLEVKLTYEEFLQFTKNDKCYYCGQHINWHPFGVADGEYLSRAYYLDRKDNNQGYSKENCVVCCFRCNKFKGTIDHNEFIVLCQLIAQNFLEKAAKAALTQVCDITKGGSCGS